MMRSRLLPATGLLLATLLGLPLLMDRLPAQEPAPDLTAQVQALEAKLHDATLAGNNAWVLTSAALVLFMTAPGLAMFYGGLVRHKNVLSVIMQCIFLMAMMTVLWAVVGYSLAFGGSDNPYIGNFDHVFMRGVERFWNGSETVTPVYDSNNPTLPLLTHMLFQGMFFIITPALICGAFAERMKFSTMVVFSLVWGLIVYCPLCHWVWDGGILAFGSKHAVMGGALDFAGGTVVHVSSGVSALICALVIGRRLGFGSEPMPPHNLTYTTLGAGMLWVGWFGFNAGSELASDGLTASAFAATHFSAAAGALVWAGIEWVLRGKPSALGASSGAVAGLVCITPAAGYVSPMASLAMGAAGALFSFVACTSLKAKLRYDDALDAFGVHGIAGTLGAILTGVFATRSVADKVLVSQGNPVGLIDGNPRLVVAQLAAVAITWVFAGVVTLILLKILDATMGLRVTQEEEVRGLDLSLHGEEGYIQV